MVTSRCSLKKGHRGNFLVDPACNYIDGEQNDERRVKRFEDNERSGPDTAGLSHGDISRLVLWSALFPLSFCRQHARHYQLYMGSSPIIGDYNYCLRARRESAQKTKPNQETVCLRRFDDDLTKLMKICCIRVTKNALTRESIHKLSQSARNGSTNNLVKLQLCLLMWFTTI